MSFGSSTGVRNRMMLAAPAMPKARAIELPMMIITIAPDTHSSTCACSIDRVSGLSRETGRWTTVISTPISAATTSLINERNGLLSGSGLSSAPAISSGGTTPAVSNPGVPSHTSAKQNAAPPAANAIVRHGHARARACSIESEIGKTLSRCASRRNPRTSAFALARRKLPPTRRAVV